jgi:hypothetical protein
VKHTFLGPQGLGRPGMNFIVQRLPQRVRLWKQVAFIHDR